MGLFSSTWFPTCGRWANQRLETFSVIYVTPIYMSAPLLAYKQEQEVMSETDPVAEAARRIGSQNRRLQVEKNIQISQTNMFSRKIKQL